VRKAGLETTQDHPGRYVLLQLARNTFADAGEVALAFDVVDDLDASFFVDADALRMDTTARLSRTAAAPNGQKLLAEHLSQLADQDVSSDRYEAATQLAKLALAAARKAQSTTLVSDATAHVAEVAQLQKAFSEVGPATAVLKDHPDDPAANGVVGKFRCLLKGEWTEGLPMLAHCGDATLAALAKKDLADPADPNARLALADEWWDLAQKETGPVKRQMQSRATSWYEKCAPQLTGLNRAKAEKRAQLQEAKAPSIKPPVSQVPPQALDPQAVKDLLASGQSVVVSQKVEQGYVIGPVKRGTMIVLSYESGHWKHMGHVASGSPDFRATASKKKSSLDASVEEHNRMVIADNSPEGKPSTVITIVPPETKTTPFVWTAAKDYGKVILRINDDDGDFASNPGNGATYRMKIVPPT
jgi:hypothetical protein